MKLKSLALAISGLMILGGCGGSGDEKSYASTPASPEPVYSKPAAPTEFPTTAEGSVDWHDIGVHDPSVVKAGNDYYIFGSHLAAAKSGDLINWEYVSSLTANHLVNESALFANQYTTEIAEGIAWTDGYTGNWAADVIQAPNGKYWFYYNHCGQNIKLSDPSQNDAEVCHHRSYLGLAEADTVEGPYVDKGVFLRSGYRNEQEFVQFPLDNEQTTYNPAIDPNAIDPAAFFDKSGELWMVYGSYSGGIYILEMDKTTGKPKAGQGYGTHLVGGDFRAIEGAYVLYSPESQYYYLFYSVAGFAANDGYNIRIARSKTPKGPYLDPAGNDIAAAAGLEVGGKLLGGFEFTQAFADETESWGYQSPGHNSAYYDDAKKRHLLIMHTRFPASATPYPGNAEAHAVRTHEMFVNRDGWLVVSPQRYVPIEGTNTVDVAEIPGHYKFVNQGKAVNKSAIKSQYITLNENRTVTGAEAGTWYTQSGDSIKLSLASGDYIGVMKWQWDNGTKKLVPVFTAMATDGSSIFGTRTSTLAQTASIVDAVSSALEIKTDLTIDDENYSLPTVAKSGATITWQSSNEYFIDAEGNVFIPTPDLGDQALTLTALIKLNGVTSTKSFNMNLAARPAFKNAIAHYTFDNNVADLLQNLDAAQPTGADVNNLSGGTLSYDSGRKGQAAVLTGANSIRLPENLVSSDKFTISLWINADENRIFSPALFATPGGDNWFSVIPGHAHFTTTSLLWSLLADTPTTEFGDWNQIVAGTTAPIGNWQHFAITYKAPVMKLYIDGVAAGEMNRANVLSNGGTFILGANLFGEFFKGKIDEVMVYDYNLSALDINGAAYNNLSDASLFSGFVTDALVLGDLSSVRENFELKRVGPFVSGIRWTSSNDAVLKPVNGTAIVTQPTADEGDKTVTLTAHITFNGNTETKDFDVTVKSLAPAEYNFDGDLSALNGVAANGKTTGDRINNTGGIVTYVSGIKGQAVNLDGTVGIRLPDNLISSSSYTISLWLKPTAFTGWTTAFFGGATPTSWLSLVPSMGTSDKTRVWADKSGYFDKAELSNRIPLNAWSHLVIMVDSENNDTIQLYVDGELKLTETGFPRVMTVDGETNEFALGVNYWDVPFNGAIDELKVFTGTVSETKIKQLYEEVTAQ
jgi:arabinan endo-1,5-alpha-L-arabinosidase